MDAHVSEREAGVPVTAGKNLTRRGGDGPRFDTGPDPAG